MKTDILKLTNLRNDEHFEFFTEFITLVNETGVNALKITQPFNALTALFSEEDEALKKISKSDLTRQIHEADEARDMVFRGLAEANLSALNHFRTDVREAAIRLQIVFDAYGNVAKMSVDAETSAIQNLIEEFRQHHAADVEKVGLTDWIEELRVRNLAVRTLTMGRDDETAFRSPVILRPMRLKVDEAYRKIIVRIDALAVIEEEGIEDEDDDEGGGPIKLSAPVAGRLRAADDAPLYAGFITRLNAVIERYNNRIAIRKGRAAAKPKEEEKPKEKKDSRD